MNVESEVPVRECMSTPVETVATETSLVEAAQTMRNASISALVVMSEPRSIVTSTDFVDAVAVDGGHIDGGSHDSRAGPSAHAGSGNDDATR
jgi:CBS domain-containing protein